MIDDRRPLARRGGEGGATEIISHIKRVPGQEGVRAKIYADGGAKKVPGESDDLAASAEDVVDVVSMVVAKEAGSGSEGPTGFSRGVEKNLAPPEGGKGIENKVKSGAAETRGEPSRGSRKMSVNKVDSRLRAREAPPC